MNSGVPFSFIDLYGGVVLFFLMSYLVGAIPFGWLIARWQGVADIRKVGSGNSGATNVGRALGKKWFCVVLALDFARAYCVTQYLMKSSDTVAMVALAFFFLGNLFSVFLGFAGGKGVATGLGIVCAISSTVALALLVLWSIIFYITRTVGIASSVGAFTLPFAWWLLSGSEKLFFYSERFMCLFVFMSMLIIIKHRTNITQYVRSLRR